MPGSAANVPSESNTSAGRLVVSAALLTGFNPTATNGVPTDDQAVSSTAHVPLPLNILLVDDSAMDRELVSRLLPPEHRLRQAATAAQARVAIEESLPDVVLLDYRLPDADGTTLLPLFAVRQIPVVMLTGMESAEIVVAAMQGGAQDYLVKNQLTDENLDRVILNAIEKGRLQRALDEQQATLARQAAALEIKNREISALASALTLAEQAERRRVSNLLHDHLQQLLFGVKLSLSTVADIGEPVRRKEVIADAERVLDEAITTTRDLAVELTPPVLDREDLEVALQWVASHMGDRYRLTVEVETVAPCRVPARELRVLLLQLVRELLFNVVKHSKADRAIVRLDESDEHYAISVIDEGVGFDVEDLQGESSADVPFPSRGFGLNSVRERLELLGGRLDIWSEPGRGTRITIHAPVSVGRSMRMPQTDLFAQFM